MICLEKIRIVEGVEGVRRQTTAIQQPVFYQHQQEAIMDAMTVIDEYGTVVVEASGGPTKKRYR